MLRVILPNGQRAETTELRPARRQKSFYGKAIVCTAEDGDRYLLSYGTYVARLRKDGAFERLWDSWSATTARHLAAFSSQYRGKASWDAMPIAKVA